MKQGWELKKLGEVCENASSNISQNAIENQNGIYPIYGAKGFIKNVNFYHQDKPYIGILKDGAGAGRVMLLEAFSSVIGTIQYLRPNENINIKYFHYFLLGMDFTKYINGSTIPHIYFKDYKEEPILLLPLSEQERIVSILNKAFSAIEQAKVNAEKNLKNAKELFDSYLTSIFTNKGDGWEEKKLKEVCAKITDGTHQTPKYFDSGIIFLSSKNVTSGRIDWKNVKYIDESQHIEMHKHISPKLGDILLAKNGTTGVAAMVDKEVIFDIYVSLAHIRPLKMVLPKYMLYFINSPFAKKQFNKRLKGSGVPNLHLEEIREVIIPFPPLLEQQTIVETLDALSAETKQLEVIYQQKLTELENFKKSILRKAFNGELL